MNNYLIILLALILLFLIILNHVSMNVTTDEQSSDRNYGNCAETTFGCCPDGINSKINFQGTNCPKYNPAPGYKV